jgi:2-haloalkanoic acid dehalogenase type II
MALPLIVFDANETLLDLETMGPTFERIFGEKSAIRLWFANLILYSAALTVAGCYVPFTDIGAAVMKMLADTRGIKIDEKDNGELTERFSTMPPYPEVPAALRKLHDAGFRLFTLTEKCKRASLHVVASSICLSEDSAQTASSTTSRRAKRMPMSRRSLESSPPSSALLPAIHGTLSAPPQRVGERRLSDVLATMS